MLQIVFLVLQNSVFNPSKLQIRNGKNTRDILSTTLLQSKNGRYPNGLRPSYSGNLPKSSLSSRRSYRELGDIATQVLDGAKLLLVFGDVVGQSLVQTLGVQRVQNHS